MCKILKYDYNGTFQTELPIENLQWGHLRRIKNGFLIQCVQPLPDGNGLIYADDKGHVIQTAMSVGEHTHLKGNLAWTEWNEEYYFYHLSTSNDLYCYDVESQNFSSKTLVEDKNVLSADEYIQKKEKGTKRNYGYCWVGYMMSPNCYARYSGECNCCASCFL